MLNGKTAQRIYKTAPQELLFPDLRSVQELAHCAFWQSEKDFYLEKQRVNTSRISQGQHFCELLSISPDFILLVEFMNEVHVDYFQP